ncbi:HGGxSTG domain-containing protein [Glaciimonas sp. GNP009]
MNTSKDKRERYSKYCKAHALIAREWKSRAYCYPPPTFPRLPADLLGLQCGARTRAGTPCKLKSIYCNGRCKFHGGLSTGPKTAEGRAKISAARRKTP